MKQDFFKQNLHSVFEVLWEGQKEEISATQHKVYGYTPNYLRVALMTDKKNVLENKITRVQTMDMKDSYLLAESI